MGNADNNHDDNEIDQYYQANSNNKTIQISSTIEDDYASTLLEGHSQKCDIDTVRMSDNTNHSNSSSSTTISKNSSNTSNNNINNGTHQNDPNNKRNSATHVSSSTIVELEELSAAKMEESHLVLHKKRKIDHAEEENIELELDSQNHQNDVINDSDSTVLSPQSSMHITTTTTTAAVAIDVAATIPFS